MMLQKFELAAKDKERNIGIGLGKSEVHNQKILKASLSFLQEYKSNVFLFGTEKKIVELIKPSHKVNIKSRMKFVECQDPENYIVEFLEKNAIDSIVRGSLNSNKFLKNLKIKLNIKTINRLALLETVNGHQFFYGPVGIDECNNFNKKIAFLEAAFKELHRINVVPKTSILSGGRIGDLGRDVKVDQTIQDAEKIVKFMKEKYKDLNISHDEILIEKAVEDKANLILAPNGISGNLIYRTLVHLGGGKAYGAIYMGLKNPIIDTSRVGKFSEIYGALILALALTN
ncbi:MAG: methanogenesis marker protein Mmp4/MtxX [Promethearchaeota archaeon]